MAISTVGSRDKISEHHYSAKCNPVMPDCTIYTNLHSVVPISDELCCGGGLAPLSVQDYPFERNLVLENIEAM